MTILSHEFPTPAWNVLLSQKPEILDNFMYWVPIISDKQKTAWDERWSLLNCKRTSQGDE